MMDNQKIAKTVEKTELQSPHQKIWKVAEKAVWIARNAEKVTETVSPKNAEEIHYTQMSAGKVALTDQKTAKTVQEISHQRAQLMTEKIEQKLQTTGKVVAEAYQRCQIVKLKDAGSKWLAFINRSGYIIIKLGKLLVTLLRSVVTLYT